ncbi:MAG: uridine diphosphate-N-acetylglucosamine-binding protein YvcK [Candidatus Saccharimonadales bacterium]
MNEPFTRGDLKIAVIGGGTGSFTLLSALKEYTRSIAALVNMADDGGSTGVLRDELGALPPGDVRQCLVALSGTPELRDLFNYRFEDGSLQGHAFGNLFLTALEKMTGDFAQGVEVASEVLNITGTVEPITLTNVKLAMRDRSGHETHGEFEISQCAFHDERPEFWLEPAAEANPKAITAIAQADIVVIAPGNLYGSLAPALIVPGIGRALAKSDAFKVYVCNLVTKPGQTDGYSVSDFADEIERLAGEPFLDAVLFNTQQPTTELLKKYAAEGELSVSFDREELKEARYLAAGADLLSGQVWHNNNKSSDPIAATRTLIRHDSKVVARSILELYDYAATH